jgi:hypothetical protein
MPEKAMFHQESIPQDFLDQLCECAAMFKDLQVNSCVISNVHSVFFGYNLFILNHIRL